MSSKFMDKLSPFAMIDQILLTIGLESDRETLTMLGVEPPTLLDLGLVVVNKSGDVACGHDDEMIGGIRDELPPEPRKPVPAVLPSALPEDVPEPVHEVEAGDAIEAVPDGTMSCRYGDNT